jgi:hypothetical protein
MHSEPSEAPSGASFFNALAVLGLLVAMLLVLLVTLGHVRAEERSRTFQNPLGQEVGRATTRGNTTTFSNERGQQTGRAERRPDGSTNFYDAQGRTLGTSRGVPTR